MNKNQVTKRAYLAPCIKECPAGIENPLLAASVSGGHHDAGDDEELNAKQKSFYDEEDSFWSSDTSVW